MQKEVANVKALSKGIFSVIQGTVFRSGGRAGGDWDQTLEAGRVCGLTAH